jgi:hypothetical protein
MFSSYALKLTFRGIDRKLQHLPRQALPITLDILDKFDDHMNFNSSIDVTDEHGFILHITLKACTGQNGDTGNAKRGILRTQFPNCIVLVHLNLTIK